MAAVINVIVESPDMSPGPSGADTPDYDPVRAEVISQDRWSFSSGIATPDLSNIVLGESRHSVSRTAAVSPLIHGIDGVIFLCSQEEMIGIPAGRIVAAMENTKAGWNGSVVQEPRQPMREGGASLIRDGSVSLVRVLPNPHKAAVEITDRLSSKSILYGQGVGAAVTIMGAVLASGAPTMSISTVERGATDQADIEHGQSVA